MPYDEKLAERVRAMFQSEPGYTEKKMFGGLCFMVGRNMAVGVTGSDLMVRPGPDNFEATLALPHCEVSHLQTKTPKTPFSSSKVWPRGLLLGFD